MYVEPTHIFYVDDGGNRVYMPAVTFAPEQYNNADTVQWGILQHGVRIGGWSYSSRTGEVILELISDISKRNWVVDTKAHHLDLKENKA